MEKLDIVDRVNVINQTKPREDFRFVRIPFTRGLDMRVFENKIAQVMFQAGVKREVAIFMLRKCEGDLVDAIMNLTQYDYCQ